MQDTPTLRVAIIGTGIAAGLELFQKVFTEFTIFDALDAPGGTWSLNTYPGLACDVWAHSYSFSYAPNPDWTASFVEQPEIQPYLARCATEFGLDSHMTLNTKISSAHYQEGGNWKLQTSQGDEHEFDVVINAMGNQHTPQFPDVPGMDSFEGDSWHGTHWNHDADLAGKRVIVVGSAASAVQIVPAAFVIRGAQSGAYPQDLDQDYLGLGGNKVAVRSSAQGEDGAEASFAGQYDSVLNVVGEVHLRSAIDHCVASGTTERTLVYQVNQGDTGCVTLLTE
ncbi:flavin-containing monooxygenase [Candidatus Marimicrobium litorale]|uniref:Pyruvate phosphate dikinase AMP/ATP-binding domain-containing protein n=1 Tax=Candidatus Marimicrobium litorale TaxID=2518991 RepID=A0ABT3TBM5_9GAMM|nr:PEP/pyruvate-binding domain-containing protein [Candidatus Marimicrobium litorale]MCX2978869.1 hypothetical protein [Candidatus Marimicrobium litorale]